MLFFSNFIFIFNALSDWINPNQSSIQSMTQHFTLSSYFHYM